MAMRYRVLQKTYKQMVGVYQSYIHGLGLFCRRDIEAGEMVIEYAGTVIRSVLTDKREKMYDARVRMLGREQQNDRAISGNLLQPTCYLLSGF